MLQARARAHTYRVHSYIADRAEPNRFPETQSRDLFLQDIWQMRQAKLCVWLCGLI